MTYALIAAACWGILGLIAGIAIGRAVKLADRRAGHACETQCPYQFEDAGTRCQWFGGHPESWGHRWDTPGRIIVGDR